MKNQKRTTNRQILSLLLALLMLFFCFPVTALGSDELEEPVSETLESPADAELTAFERGVGELGTAELESMTLNAADVPEVVTAQAIAEKDHVLRLYEQEEDLNTVIFQNRDGGKTVYLYADPVKYVDDDGNVKDRSTALTAGNVIMGAKVYAYSATDNSFGQYYPTQPQNGVLLAFGEYFVEMTPVITGILTLRDTTLADNKVTYNKVFGNGTSLVYTPTLSGVKEDIILQAYTGKSSFSFTVKTNGLAIIQQDGDTFLTDFEGNKVASLGKVIITDKVGKMVYGSMTVATKIEREEYTVTINAPTAFLTSATTVYPVTVDPTVTIDEYMDDYGNEVSIFEDVCLHTSSEAPTYQNYAIAGNYSFDWSDETSVTSRMLYTISNEARGSLSSYLNTAAFWSASLKFTGKTLNTYVTVNAYPFVGNASGSSAVSQQVSTNVYNNIVSSYLSQTTLRSTTEALLTVNVTEALRYWIYESEDADIKFVLATSGEGDNDPDSYDRLYIKQSGGTTADVCLVIDYTNLTGLQYINASSTGKFLSYSSSTSNLRQTSYSPTSLPTVWNFTYMGANKYKIALATNPSMLLAMDDYDNVIVDHELDLDSEYHTWEISSTRSMRNLGTNTYLCADSSNTDLFYGSDAQTTWRFCKPNDYVPINSVSIADIYLSTNSTSTPAIVKGNNNATWSNRSDFTWSSSNTSAATVSESGTVSVPASVTDKGFSIITVKHKPTNCEYKFTVVVNQPEFEGCYYIRNVKSGNGIEQSTYTSAVQNTISTSDAQKVYLTHRNNGYYTIGIIYNGDEYYLSYGNGNNTTGTSMVVWSEGFSDAELWRIIPTENENYKIKSKCAEYTDTVLSVTSSTAGEALSQGVYTDNNNYYDEWKIIKQYDVVFLGVPDNSGGHNHEDCFTSIESSLRSTGYNSAVYEYYIEQRSAEVDKEKFLELLQGATIFVMRGHLSRLSIPLYNGNNSVSWWDIIELPDNSLGSLDLIVYCGCEAGKGGELGDNIVNATYGKGANTVIGFEDTIDCDDANAWIVNLFDYIKSNENCSMQSAVESAKNQNYDFEGIKTEYIAGGSNTIWQN